MGRRVTLADGGILHELIQTNALISPGSLGGPMLDVDGDVVGLLTAVEHGDGADFGYATTADLALDVANSLVDDGTPADVWLGLMGSSLTPDVAEDLGLAGGALIGALDDETSPARAAGLAVGDVITAVDGVPVTSFTDLILRLREHRPRETIEVEYLRNGVIDSAFPILTETPRPPAGSIWGVS
jgi:S1-C subfamily serine protease